MCIRDRVYETDSLNHNRVNNLADLVRGGGYGMWMEEAQSNSGKKLQPSQIFVPELEPLLESQTTAELAMENGGSVSEGDEISWEENQADTGYRCV